MTEFTTLNFERLDAFARITLNRPDAANGMNMAMGRELRAVAAQCKNDSDIRAVIITGAGKMFSAGGDLKAFAAYGDEIGAAILELANHLHAAIEDFSGLKAPVITAINGMAAGAGFSLAVCSDIALCAASAKFTMAYTAAGLSPDGGASYFLPRLIGLRLTQELMLCNRRLSAEEALQYGLVTRVIDDEHLQEEALSLARQLANGPTRAFGAVKQLLRDSHDNNLHHQLADEAESISRLSTSHDGQEGIQAFLEKRKAVYKGQ
ncbi:MAG: enoyl-CoA hydratase/isomerase family protein [Pseudomonadales bacterium]|nr:enoyl-CoA hydratase/isomerase family protein [Pseudomonadales bacterium]